MGELSRRAADSPERERNIDLLLKRYQAGGRTFGRLTYLRKRLFWQLAVGGAAALKRLIDIYASAAGLLILSPIFLFTALCIKLEDFGPLFYNQKRVGKHGKIFLMYKFRSMVSGADKLQNSLADKNESGGVIFKIKRDPRLTKVGRIIRKLSIDELPQLYNVLKGEMSLVGPRPPVPSEVEKYTLDQRRRLEVVPGITCLWQISGRSDLNFEQQVALDKQYIESQSLLNDLLILLRTIPAVISGKGAY